MTTPFSFFNWIFISESDFSDSYRNAIIRHEKAHAMQLHTFDLILTELFCILLWFNPFVYFFKRSVKTVHEYLADENVVDQHFTKINYMELISAYTVSNNLSGLTSNFSYLTLKKRINMLTNIKSSRLKSLNYISFIVAIAMLLQAFSIQNTEIDNPPSRPPIDKSINENLTVSFGVRIKNPVTHKVVTHGGIDLKASIGTAVYATASGKAIRVVEKESWGKLIVIKHDDVYETWYAHLNDFEVEEGEQVKLGQLIGHVGNTGYSSGSHLHYEVRKNGERVNPAEFMGVKE